MRLELIGDVFECLDGFTTAKLIGTSAYVQHEIKRMLRSDMAEDERFKKELLAVIPQERYVRGLFDDCYVFAITHSQEIALGKYVPYPGRYSADFIYLCAPTSSESAVCRNYHRQIEHSRDFIHRAFAWRLAREWFARA